MAEDNNGNTIDLPDQFAFGVQFASTGTFDGSLLEAWTYIYNWPVEALVRIESGRFL